MHHRALRLLPSTPLAYPSSLSFSSVLQVAAGRAWARSTTSTGPPLHTRPSASVHDQDCRSDTQAAQKPHRLLEIHPGSPVVQSPLQGPLEESFHASVQKKKAEAASKPSSSSPARPPVLVRRARAVASFDPGSLHDSDWQPSDPASSYLHPSNASLQLSAHSEHPWYQHDASIVGTQVGRQVCRTRTSPLVPLAKTSTTLYQNLLYLLSYRDPVPTLPALLDYHDLHSGLRSTRSYNLLISLALRNRSYGTVPWLLESMHAESIPGNVETWKLRIRWLVQTKCWDKAWNEVMSTNVRGKGATKGRFQVSSALPLPVWLEFSQALKRGAEPRRATAPGGSDISTTKTASLLPEPRDVYLTRYHTLMNNPPAIIPHDLAQTPPKAVYSVVSIMLDHEQTEAALSLTRAYLTSLPPRISNSCARTCLDIIHLHMVAGSSQRGLRRLYETRRTTVSLISLHPALRPTSTTLFLLLAPLRHAKRCGTVAWNIYRTFRAQWGGRIEDRREIEMGSCDVEVDADGRREVRSAPPTQTTPAAGKKNLQTQRKRGATLAQFGQAGGP
ncbi:hypothetical protein LshimejAT787_0303410 [Lyophyllum shimeji]|uniref:Uncharacterized protein n=1 Tax=Lyophyllum shimeji TaxID=47721 RepID=A0A9P3UJW9_LYOSH|nr:hypothetical protein LshimejAT787_0303410 [Lyophyllum shimeji]